jgi:hypothetical protein
MVERRPPQAPQASGPTTDRDAGRDAGQREDTVAIPVSRPAPSNGNTTDSSSGSGRVLPPMPKEAPPARSATPPPPPSSRPTSQTPSKPAAASPAPKPAAPAPAPAPVAKQRPPMSPMPVVPEVDKRAERQAEREAKAAERAAAKQAAREQKETRSPAKAPQVAETKDAPKVTRRARLRMTRIDPWSVMKTSFLLSIALGIVVVVSVFMVWSVLDAADVWSSINQTVRDVLGGESAATFDIEDYIGTRRVVGFAMIVAAVDVVLLTAIATLGAFLYNMSASLLGGIEVTLAEDK